MNKDNAKDYLPLVKALSEGKTIQVLEGERWIDVTSPSFIPPHEYRIKQPEPEKWVACGKTISTCGFDDPCNRPVGHSGPFNNNFPDSPPSPVTCVHCGKDPNVRTQKDKDDSAYFDWMNKCMENNSSRNAHDAWMDACDYARKEVLK